MKTVALIASVPSVNATMFAVLPPGTKLGTHRDSDAGSLRHHLRLVTPNAAGKSSSPPSTCAGVASRVLSRDALIEVVVRCWVG